MVCDEITCNGISDSEAREGSIRIFGKEFDDLSEDEKIVLYDTLAQRNMISLKGLT